MFQVARFRFNSKTYGASSISLLSLLGISKYQNPFISGEEKFRWKWNYTNRNGERPRFFLSSLISPFMSPYPFMSASLIAFSMFPVLDPYREPFLGGLAGLFLCIGIGDSFIISSASTASSE